MGASQWAARKSGIMLDNDMHGSEVFESKKSKKIFGPGCVQYL
jgi:hypothetical protein